MTRARLYLRAGEALLALVLSQLLLRLLPLDAIVKRLGFIVDEPRSHVQASATAAPGVHVRRAIDSAAARLPWQPTCLVRALAGSMMLTRRGVGSVVVLGVRRDDASLAAHAWLAVDDGTVCGGEEAANYRPLAAFRRGCRISA